MFEQVILHRRVPRDSPIVANSAVLHSLEYGRQAPVVGDLESHLAPVDQDNAVASRRVVGIEHAILGGDQSEGVSSLTDASSLSTTR